MRRLAAVLALTAVLASCGGGNDREEFVEQANANCAERQRTELELRERPPEEALDDADAIWRAFDRELEQQRELEPPEDMADDWRRYQELSRESVAAYREVMRLQDGRDFNERSVAEGRALRAGTQSRIVARRLGLDVCAKQIY